MKRKVVHSEKNKWLPWLVWGVAALFYYYQFILRSSPCIMADQLMGCFAVHATSFGFLTACYYFPYTLLQIPMGAFLDRFGPKAILGTAVLLSSLGTLIFSSADHIWIAGFGRILIGTGAAAAFLSAIRLATLWFPAKKLAFVIGLTVTLGTLGGISAGWPLSKLTEYTGWRNAMAILAFFGFTITVLVWTVVRNSPRGKQDNVQEQKSWSDIGSSLMFLLKQPVMWAIGLYGSLMYVPLTVFTDAWGVSFLIRVHDMTHASASIGIMLLFLGLAFGSPLIAILSDHLENRWKPMLFSGILSVSANGLLVLVPHLSVATIFVLLFSIGVFMSGQTLVFSAGCQLMPLHMSGMVLGIINMIVMMGGLILQPLTGAILDGLWTGVMCGMTPIYTTENYQQALLVVPVCIAIACLLMKKIPETYPKPNG